MKAPVRSKIQQGQKAKMKTTEASINQISVEHLSNPTPVDRLASSIHAIHRPLARSRRRDIPGQKRPSGEVVLEEPESYLSDEEVEQDFEESKAPEPRPRLSQQSHSLPPLGNHSINASTSNPFKFANTRTGSMATIRLHRRARLAEKLRDVFELDGIKEVQAGGYMLCYVDLSFLS